MFFFRRMVRSSVFEMVIIIERESGIHIFFLRRTLRSSTPSFPRRCGLGRHASISALFSRLAVGNGQCLFFALGPSPTAALELPIVIFPHDGGDLFLGTGRRLFLLSCLFRHLLHQTYFFEQKYGADILYYCVRFMVR